MLRDAPRSWLLLLLIAVLSSTAVLAAQGTYLPALEGARSEVYKTIGDIKLRLYIYEPAASKTNRPAMVFFFGGGWQNGTPSQFEQQCRHFAARGMVAITADYRVGSRQGARAADCVADAKSCVRWIRQNAERLGIDPQRIVAAGGSAGGHIAAATATLPGFDKPDAGATVGSVPNALVLFNPALVLAPMEGLDLRGFGVNLGKERLGAEPGELSPAHHIKPRTPPTLILHGKADTTVPFVTAEAFATAMKRAGNRCDLIGYDGQSHGFFNYGRGDGRYYQETLAAADAFLVSLGYLAPQPKTQGASSPSAVPQPGAHPKEQPNLLFILCDDLGYGDVHCFNPGHGLIRTPHLDRLAAEGMRFTDAHSSSAVCTPTRYGILTGRYNWRTRLQNGVLGGFSPPLIAPDRLTVPALLRQHGYATAAIGKWHLGLTWPRQAGAEPGAGNPGDIEDSKPANSVEWSQPIQNGPTTLGFDSYFGISASLDMPPFAFIRNDRVTVIPTTQKKWVRSGPAAADFEAVDVLPALTAEAISVIKSRATAPNAGNPFFLYLALTSPHTPVVPARDWQGRSGLGDYADFVMQTDHAIGQVVAALDAAGLGSNTLVIATSDNGFSPAGDPQNQLRNQGHLPSASLRGSKADIWDGGHRIPFIARWPGRVQAGSTNGQLICLNDLMATCADWLGVKLPDDAGEDSVSFLPALLGSANGPQRESLVHHSINGSFAIRQGHWKLERCPGSGGWSDPKPGSAQETNLPPVQLYDLSADLGERTNLQAEHPEVVARLTALLEKYVADGRSTPGAKQTNDVEVKLQRRTGRKR